MADATPVAEFASCEIAAALAWTQRAATTQLDLATDIVRRLPDVHAAMALGDLDLPKARVIRDAVATLELGQARATSSTILPLAPGLTTGQLAARLAKLVIEADPTAAQKRHQAKVRQRRVVLQPAEDSCANIFGLDLPADTALAASRRITSLAQTVKQAGDPRSLDQLRADTFLDLLLGNTSGAGAGGVFPGDAAAAGTGRRGSVELVASLETLTGLADKPGHLNGYGPVIAEIARQIAAQQREVPWSFAIYDDATGEVHTGALRKRPNADCRATHPRGSTTPADTRKPPHQRPASPQPTDRHPHGSERQPPRSEGHLQGRGRHLHTNARPASAGMRPRDNASGVTGEPRRGGPEHDVQRHGDRKAAATKSRFGDPRRRFPNAALTRHIRARDRTCRAPGCRRLASRADLDHTIAYEAGGLTVPGNLGPLCRFHHRAKHRGGWTLHQLSPGIFIWQSPVGKLYIVKPDPPP